MAITRVGTSTFGTAGSNSASVTNSVPSGTTDGDRLFWHIASPASTSIPTPTGWTLEQESVAAGLSSAVFSRTASSEPGSYTHTTTSFRYAAIMVAYRGVDSSTPLDVAMPTAAAGTTTASAPPAVTPVTGGAYVLGFAATTFPRTDEFTLTSSNMTLAATAVSTITSGSTNDARASLFEYAQSTPATFTPAATSSGTTIRSSGQTLVLRPATGGGSDTTAPSVPTITAVTGTSTTTLRVDWSASTDDTAVASYRVLRDGAVEGDGGSVTGLTWTDTVADPPGTSFTYTVSAVDAAGNRSAESSPVSGETLLTDSPTYTPEGMTAGVTVTVPPYMSTARRYTVHVDELPDITVIVAESAVSSPTTLVFGFPGGEGDNYWTANLPDSQLVDDLAAAGKKLITVYWETPWFEAPTGQRAGMSRMAARIAAVIEHIETLNPTATDLHVIGGSWGSMAAINWASFYDSTHRASRIITTAGPYPHASWLCSTDPAHLAFHGRPEGSTGGSAAFGWLDKSLGYYTGTRPCYDGNGEDSPYEAMFSGADFTLVGDLDYTDRSLSIFIGEDDPDDVAERVNGIWTDELTTAGVPHTYEVLPDTGHNVHGYQNGVDAILEVFLAPDLPAVAAHSGFFMGAF